MQGHKDLIRAGAGELGESVLFGSPFSAWGKHWHPGRAAWLLPCDSQDKDCLDGRLLEWCRVVDTVVCVTAGRKGSVLVARDYLHHY